MAKEIAKMKDELRAEFLKLKEEMRAELKEHREAVERQMRNEIRELKTEQQALAKSLEFAYGNIEDLKKQLNDETTKNVKLASENEALHAKNAAMQSTLQDLEMRLVHMEQYSRKANLEVQGVIRKDGESVTEIISKVGSAINEPIDDSDIEACHRVPTRNPDRSHIIVQFKSRTKRDAVLKKAKRTRLTNNDLGLESMAPVFVNEHLCPAQKKLLAMAVKRKHEHHWKSVWSYIGKIFAKEADDSPIVPITHENDLGKICAKKPTSTPSAEHAAVTG